MGKRKTTVRLGIGLAVVAAVLAVFAWQQGDGSGDDGGPLNAIAAAAERTQSQPGGRTMVRATIAAPNPSDSFLMTGHGTYDDAMERTWMEMEIRDPDSDDQVDMEMVMDGTVIYMSSSKFDGELPDGRSWMSIDLSVVPGFDTEVPGEGDPKAELEMLKEATGARKIGREKVRGVQTTRYAGELDGDGASTQLEVWIDSEGLVRRLRIVGGPPPEGDDGPTKMDMRMDFFDFGPVPVIEVPDESEVFDATAMAEDGLEEE